MRIKVKYKHGRWYEMKTVYNLKAKYILIAREIKVNLATKYIISDFNGKTRKITEDDLIELAKNGPLANCVYDGIIKGIGMSLRHLPTYNKYTKINYREGKEEEIINDVKEYRKSKIYKVSKRIMMGKQCVGYELQSLLGQTGYFKRDTVIAMIQLGYIPSVSYQLYNDKHYIKGKEQSLNRLESVDINEAEISNLL